MSSLIGSLGLNMTFAVLKATYAVGNNRKKDNPTFIDRMRIASFCARASISIFTVSLQKRACTLDK